MIVKKSDWLGLIFLIGLVALVVLTYLISLGAAVIAYPFPALLVGVFGVGTLIQSIQLSSVSHKNSLPIIIFAVLFFVITVLMVAKDTQSPEEIVNGFAISYSVFIFFWYLFAIYKNGLVVDEVHIFSLSVVSALLFLSTTSWWWYLNIAFVALSFLALFFHRKIHGFLRFLLFAWFTAINAVVLWMQFGEVYKKVFSITEIKTGFSLQLLSEMFAAGLAAPVALFPLFHALLLVVLGMLVLLTFFRRHRIKEFTDQLYSITGSIENIPLRDWRVISVTATVVFFSALGALGVIDKTLAVNIAYAALGLWMSFRIQGDTRQTA